MAKLINPPGSGTQQATSGERRVAARLESLLEDDYLCWFDVPIGPKRQHPDFVILHPSRGLLVLEVKDWRIDTMRRIDKLQVELLLESGVPKRVDNPLAQARAYTNAVINCLSKDSALCEAAGYHQGKVCFPYGYGVVLTNITRRQLDERLTPEEQDLVLPARHVICKDEMTESADAMEFQERLWNMQFYSFGRTLTVPQIERIRWHLFPEVRISTAQGDFFPTTSEAGEVVAIPEIIRVMDLHQEQLARNLGAGHRVIHGVAGSGKTLLLGYRCVQLAPAASKPILVLCFNITLAARLRSFVAGHQVSDKVHVVHFHGWCKTQLETYHAPLLETGAQPWEEQVLSVIAGVEKGLIPREQYSAVMIDEGHDFEPEWLKLLVQMVDPASDSLLLLYDDAQSIYRKANGLGFTLSSVGIKAPGRTTILRLNYRNTREILQFAYAFAKGFIAPHAADEDHIPLLEPEAAGVSGPRPAFRMKNSIGEEVDYAVSCVRKWHLAGEPLNEIAVICLGKTHGRQVREQLRAAGIDTLFMGSGSGKKAYAAEQLKVSILSPYSSKGLEFKCVVFIGLGALKKHSEAQDARLLYVGMTRAREKLILTASCPNVFTEKLLALAA